ncbi:MAG: adenylate/guanylate cyclase domain-containing protein [Deltaproteobacteria bacterium]|nr:adenylate/guanylate cyclase domain-containing protein [Deltaproteobacteria bacterium]
MLEKAKGLFTIRPLTITILVLLLVGGAYVVGVPFLDLMEFRTVDLRFRFRGEQPPLDKVALVVIDEKSIAEQGKWVWPRSKMAKLITAISDAGAACVGLDVGFLEPDDNAAGKVVSRVRKLLAREGVNSRRIERGLAALEKAGDHDAALAGAIKNSKCPVVLGYFFQLSAEGLGELHQKAKEENLKNARASLYNTVRRSPGARDAGLIPAFAPESNVTPIAQATDFAGFFNMVPDRDGTVRRLPMVLACEGGMYAPLSLKTLQAYLRRQNPDARENLHLVLDAFGVSEVRVGSRDIPVDEHGRLLINYMGGPKTFPHVSATDLLEGRKLLVDKGMGKAEISLKDKIVLVGATAVGIYDLRVTPFSEIYPGLEIHANVVDNILSRRFLRQPNWVRLLDLFAIFAVSAILGGLLPRLNIYTGGLMSLGLFAGYLGAGQYLFAKGAVVNLVYPLAALLVMYVSTTLYKYLTEEREKRFLRGAFSTYLAPSVVDQILKSPDKLALGGEKRVITAFFSDVQGFTSISQKLDPEELVELLNEFLTEMTDIILQNEGTVDKYEGDAIIAFFGAPVEMPDHAARACVACVQMQKRLVDLRAKFAAEGRPLLHMRIGMDTGFAVVGNMGSSLRMDYTMMGDMVNTAARLEGVNKAYGTYTMVSMATYQQAKDQVFGRELDAVNVVGRDEPVRVVEILDLAGEVPGNLLALAENYEKALAAYRNRDFAGALKRFEAILETEPNDGPSATMAARCREYLENPPPEDWDGSYTMTSK